MSAMASLRAAPQRAALCAIALLLVGLILVPLLTLVRSSLAPAGQLPFDSLQISFENFLALFAASDTPRLFGNTALYALGTMVFALVTATVIAWLTERTDLPGRGIVRVLMFSWLAIPPAVLGFGWILLINPGNGVLNVWLRGLFGLAQAPFTIYSMWTLIIVTGIALTPTGYVMISGLLRNMDPQLEQAALLSGAGRITILRRITLPLLSPGLLSVAIFMFMSVVQTFDLPAIIGLTARIPVLSTRVYLLSSPDMGVPNYGISAALGVLLLIVALLLIRLYFRMVGQGDRFAIVAGRAFRPGRISLGFWRYPATLMLFGYLLATLTPVFILLWTSLLPAYAVPSLSALPLLSLDTYRRVLGSPMVVRAIGNTIVLVLSSASLVMLLACLAGWLTTRDRSRLARFVDIVAFLPTAVPPIVIAMALTLLYLRTPLYGTLAILVIAHLTAFLAFGTRTMAAAFLQLRKELADAALICGASWLTALRRIVAPLVLPQLVNGWIWVAAHSARDLTVPLVMMTTGNVVLSTAIWVSWDLPDLPGASAMAILLVVGLMAMTVPAQIYVSRRR